MLDRALMAKPPDIIVSLKPGLPLAARERLWREALNHPAIQVVSGWAEGGEYGCRVGFQPGTTSTRRDEVVREVGRSPLVGRVQDYSPHSEKILSKHEN